MLRILIKYLRTLKLLRDEPNDKTYYDSSMFYDWEQHTEIWHFGILKIFYYLCKMEMIKSELNKLHLVELKTLCKERGIQYGGTKTQLINKLIEYEKEPPVVVHSHPNSLSPQGKKIVGAKFSDNELRIRIGKEIEKGKAQLLYYSMGVHYYQVNEDF